MKKILFLLSILAATGSISQAQSRVKEPKGINTIVALNPEGMRVNYGKTVSSLMYEGFGIQYADSLIGIISTQPRATMPGYTIIINALISDSTIAMRGQMASSMSLTFGSATAGPSATEMTKKGQKGSPLRESWNMMEKVARTLSDSLIYEIR